MDALSPVERSERAREKKAALHQKRVAAMNKARTVKLKILGLGFGKYDKRKTRWILSGG